MDDEEDLRREEWLSEFLDTELREMSEAPMRSFLASHGDAIEERVRLCLDEALALRTAGFPGAALVRAAAGIEITIRFFLARRLLQGAFLSDEWSRLLSQKVLNGKTAEDRELLPAILRNWKIDLVAFRLPSGLPLWQTTISDVWRHRNNHVHRGDSPNKGDALTAIESLQCLLDNVVSVGGSASRLYARRNWVLVGYCGRESRGVSRS